MNWVGKAAGAAVGAVLLRQPLGIALGLLLGHSVDQRLAARPKFQPIDADADALRILGVDAKASAADIERAWRRQIAQCHPDRVEEALRGQAEQRSREINAAYRRLKGRSRA